MQLRKRVVFYSWSGEVSTLTEVCANTKNPPVEAEAEIG